MKKDNEILKKRGDYIKNTLANMLIYYRKKNKWSQQEVADKLNISRSTYANYEQNTRRPPYETIEAIADLYTVPVSLLLGYDPENVYHDENEVLLIETYREMSANDKTLLLAYVKAYQDIKKGGEK